MIIKLLVLDLCISAKSADILGGLVNVMAMIRCFSQWIIGGVISCAT